MLGSFDFSTADRILFGPGRLGELKGLIGGYGRRILLLTGNQPERAGSARRQLVEAGCSVTEFAVTGEPTVAVAEEAALRAREVACDAVVAMGGGSVLDAAKAAAALATNLLPALDYLEVIGGGKPLTADPLPTIAIPTTAGTGAEVTRNAVLLSPEARTKASLRSTRMFPKVALVDPETTLSLPPEISATTGMDAFTQLIESFLSCRANTLTDAICRGALPRVARSLERSVFKGRDLDARTDLAFGSLCSGLALSNAGLGAVHGLAAPLGARHGIPHGTVCAALLVPVLQANFEAATAEEAFGETLDRFRKLAQLILGENQAEPGKLIDWLNRLRRVLPIPSLGEFGVKDADLKGIGVAALSTSSMKGNPVPLGLESLVRILEAAL